MNAIGEIIGKICAAALPIPADVIPGNPDSPVAVCTLSDMGLLGRIGNSEIMNDVCIAGRLLSENKGIDCMVKYSSENCLGAVIVCGKEVQGHMAGHSLFALHKNGTDSDGRITGSRSPDPYLDSAPHEIDYFKSSVELVDLMGETRLDAVAAAVNSRLSASCS